MISRRSLLAAAGSLIIVSYPCAQPRATLKRVGILSPAQPQDPLFWQLFYQRMRDMGWIEGKNIHFVFRYAEGDFSRLPAMASGLVIDKVDVLVALNSPATSAAIKATRTLPIVMIAVGDPVGTGFVKSLARPEGNVTGPTNNSGELAGKRLEILREAVPAARRVAVMGNPEDPVYAPQRKRVVEVAGKLGITVVMVNVRQSGDLSSAFQQVAEARADAVLRLADPFVSHDRFAFAKEALAKRLPTISIQGVEAEAGALLAYGADGAEQYALGAVYVDRILKGSKPGELPVEQPTKFQFVVNLKTASALGIKLPQSILVRADKVIE